MGLTRAAEAGEPHDRFAGGQPGTMAVALTDLTFCKQVPQNPERDPTSTHSV